jgi:hypothetical protein
MSFRPAGRPGASLDQAGLRPWTEDKRASSRSGRGWKGESAKWRPAGPFPLQRRRHGSPRRESGQGIGAIGGRRGFFAEGKRAIGDRRGFFVRGSPSKEILGDKPADGIFRKKPRRGLPRGARTRRWSRRRARGGSGAIGGRSGRGASLVGAIGRRSEVPAGPGGRRGGPGARSGERPGVQVRCVAPSPASVRLQRRAIRGVKVPAGPVPSGLKPKETASPRGGVESNWR